MAKLHDDITSSTSSRDTGRYISLGVIVTNSVSSNFTIEKTMVVRLLHM